MQLDMRLSAPGDEPRERVERHLRQVCAALVDQLDLRRAAFAIFVAESGGQLQAACPSADDEDLVRGLASGGLTAVHCQGGRHNDQNALLITPPSTRSAAPVVAEASGLAM